MSVKILLADDHTIIRQGLRSLLEKQPDLEVVRCLGEGGGYVFNNTHNITAGIPPEKIIAMYEAAGGAGIVRCRAGDG